MFRPDQIQPGDSQREKAPAPREAEQTSTKVETPAGLANLKNERLGQVQASSTEAIDLGRIRTEKAVKTIGGTPEDLQAGQAELAPVQQKIDALKETTEKKLEALDVPKETAPAKYDTKQLAELRAKTKDDYGKSLVQSAHKDGATLEEDEAAQRLAYEGLAAKIESGAVKPDSIDADMLGHLGLTEQSPVHIENVEEISGQIGLELKSFIDKGLIKPEEAQLIQKEADSFAKLYGAAFEGADPNTIFEVSRDNARKLAYQTERDKNVFSGSDHGTRHILQGNMTMADRMIVSLGDKVSDKDKVLIHQIIIDHDLGYTVGVAQAETSFAASKDHPLFSTAYIESNQDYYKKMFGEEGYKMIRDGILQHSYPKSEYNTPTDPQLGFNPDLIRSVTSTVDSLGVTAEIKCPAFFREPQVISILQKIKLFADTHEGNITPEIMSKYKDEMRTIADNEPDAARKQAFYSAIENQLSEKTVKRTAETTLGQYAGILKDIQLSKREDGKIVPTIKMDISRAQALIGDLFGDPMANQAFNKAMEDLGVPEEKRKTIATTIRNIRQAKTEEEKQTLMKDLKFDSDKATFEFSPTFAETDPEINKTFEDFETLSIRKNIHDLTRKLESPEARNEENISALTLEFSTEMGTQIEPAEMDKIIAIREKLIATATNNDEFKKVLREFHSIMTQQEKDFLGI